MRITLVAPGGPVPRWHMALAERLAAAGHAVGWRRGPAAPPEPAAVALLLRFEGLLYRRRGPSLAKRVDPGAVPAPDGPADLTIDLSGVEAEDDALRLRFDGSPDPAGLACAILADRNPELCVVRGDRLVARALPALEQRGRLGISLDQALERAVDLLAAAAAAHRAGPAAAIGRAPRVSTAAAMRFLAAGFADKALGRLLRRDEAWNIAWRPRQPAPPDDTATWTEAPFAWLPWDPARYLADPFVIEHEGRTVILCEDLPFSTGRGVISAVTFDAAGRPGRPEVVLERPYHLSYPFVFRHAGEIWMIPETSANRTVELYRAARFPDRWELESVLIRDICAGDATVAEIDGTWWLFASTTGGHGSSWDALSLFSAPSLRGPWRPHPGNPVLIDAAAARPAGAMWRAADGLWRPAQDCSARYGGGIALCRVDRLDAEGYGQSVRTRLYPDPTWSALGCHTFNRSEHYEVIDAVWPTTRGRIRHGGMGAPRAAPHRDG